MCEIVLLIELMSVCSFQSRISIKEERKKTQLIYLLSCVGVSHAAIQISSDGVFFFLYCHTHKTRSLCMPVIYLIFFGKCFSLMLCAYCGLQCNYWSLYKRFQEVFAQLYEGHAPCKSLFDTISLQL